MQRSSAGLALGLALLLSGLHPGEALAVSVVSVDDLIGTWHVLAHYKDSGTDHPDRERWVDRVWRFEFEGEKLKWTDFPIVVFEDQTGRFERLGGHNARTLQHWEPNGVQLADIGDGLQVNQRGSKAKTLKAAGGDDWSSAGRARPQSMTFISYVETWSITGLPDAPVFERADSLSSGMTETLDGVTRYSTTAVQADGGLLSGRYERDGTQLGTFEMRRAGATESVRGSGKSQGERNMEAWFGSLGAALGSEGAMQATLQAETQRQIQAGEVDDETREGIRAEIRQNLGQGMRDAGADTRSPESRAALDSLTRKVERLMIDEKKMPAEIAEMFQKGEIRP